MPGFTIATLLPLPMLLMAALLGGVWAWVSLLYLVLFSALFDHLLPRNWQNRNPGAEFPASQGLAMVLGLAHLWLIIVMIRWIGGPGGAEGGEAVVAGLAYAAWFGQVSHPVAHELIHRPARQARQLGRLVYITLLFGHHASSHPKVHHVHVASPADPNTARYGESFYAFWPRAWLGSFWAGLKAEQRDLRRAGRSTLANPYLAYILGAGGLLALAWAMSGTKGLLVTLGVCGLAQMQILLSDYIQHYGLSRQEGWNGRLEPVGPHHSWNSPHALSGATMLNAPRHSDHHMNPMRPFPALQMDAQRMPVLPYALPVMAAIAFVPPVWRRVMDHRAAERRTGGTYADGLGFAQ